MEHDEELPFVPREGVLGWRLNYEFHGDFRSVEYLREDKGYFLEAIKNMIRYKLVFEVETIQEV